jgi:1,4-dihydroxy-2-naphthoate octaprenyltransferase
VNKVLKHPYFRHLRLSFNLLLTPIFLWGVLLAGGNLWSWDFWLAYFSLHIFLYGGTTAFNSYYDKDEGPIGGMLEPPLVDKGLLWFSLIVQALGLPLALGVSGRFSLAWILLFLIAGAYSHPITRWKANPYGALVAVALGQGALGFVTGWLVARPNWSSLLGPDALLGMLTTALIVTGLYIVTQSYQTLEDAKRGDRTISVMLGPSKALYLATVLLAIGGSILLSKLLRFSTVWTLVLGLVFLAMGLSLLLWARHFDESSVKANFVRAMWTTSLSSAALSLFLLFQLIK